MRMVPRFAVTAPGRKAEILDVVEAEEAGIKHADVRTTGAYAYGYRRAEMGIPPSRTYLALRRAGASSDVVRGARRLSRRRRRATRVTIEDKDIRLDTYRAAAARAVAST
jgi:peptide chain release factor 2